MCPKINVTGNLKIFRKIFGNLTGLCLREKPESEPTAADIAGVVSRALVALHG
jgi:hypothetical protein